MTRYKEPTSLTLGNFVLLAISLSIAYAGWKYLPVYWQKQKVQEMMLEVLIEANRANDDILQQNIVKRMASEFGMQNVVSKDVIVSRSDTWINGDVYYLVVIDHLNGYQHQFWMHAHVRRRLLTF